MLMLKMGNSWGCCGGKKGEDAKVIYTFNEIIPNKIQHTWN